MPFSFAPNDVFSDLRRNIGRDRSIVRDMEWSRYELTIFCPGHVCG